MEKNTSTPPCNHSKNDAIQPTIARSPKDRADCVPDWRHQLTQRYLVEIEKSEDPGAKFNAILMGEPDEFVRQLLQFHHGQEFENKAAIEYAASCLRVPEMARTIKAMVVAGRSCEQIAQKMGTLLPNIECFEKLFFDVRPYLHIAPWLRAICWGENGHRLLQVAYRRGWPGVQEIALQQLPKGSRGLNHITSVLHGRAEDHLFALEASNSPVGEKDLQMLSRLGTTSRARLDLLDDPEESDGTPNGAPRRLMNLSAGGREQLIAFFQIFGAGLERKAAENASSASPAKEESAGTVQPGQHEKPN